MSTPVSYQVTDRVAIVTINRPDKRNSMSMDVFAGLLAAGRQAAKDSSVEGGVGAVLVRGAGGVFSSGIDIAAFGDQMADGPTHEHIHRLQESFTVFEDIDVPSIAAIEGYCFGAGIQLAAACHVRLVAPSAELSIMETRWGLVPDLGGCYRIPRLIGLGRATELALTARRVGADEALSIGLCDVALTSEDPQKEALAYAVALANGPGAVRRIPRLMRENLARRREDGLQAERATQLETMAGPDFTEAVTAGFAKRQPNFLGR